MTRRPFITHLLISLAALLLLSVEAQAEDSKDSDDSIAPLHQHRPSDPNNPLVAKHGFFMLGTDQLYLYHSVQFQVPAHAFQMIIKATLPEAAMNAYRADVAAHANDGSVWLVHNHVPFALQSLSAGSTFQTNVKRLGPDRHYQKPYTVPDLVTLTVDQVTFLRPLGPGNSYMQPPATPYIYFGTSDEKFLAHQLTKYRDYDVLAKVTGYSLGAQQFQMFLDLMTYHTDGGPLPTSSPLLVGHRYGQFGVQPTSIYWFDTVGLNEPANPPSPPPCGQPGQICNDGGDCCSGNCYVPGSHGHTTPFGGTCR